jgi:hypothetical protein
MTPGRKTIASRRILLVCMMAFCVAGLLATAASRAQEEVTTRHLWDTAFINQGNKGAAAKRSAKRNYRIVTPHVPVIGVSPDTVIGVTLWRLRPSRPADAGERIIAHEGAESVEWLPERVSSGARLAEGDRIRMSVEAARTGYLYVIDREQYADGTQGEPYLIFPTTRTRGGDNSVKAGRVMEIPSQDDNPPYFTLKRRRANHIGESVTVLVTPIPIEGLEIGEKMQRLPDEKVATWEKVWGAQAGRLELENGPGKQWTRQEKEAGADVTRSLSEDEPAPQTIYYRPGARSTVPVLVKVQLQYARLRLPVRSRR